LVMCSTYSGCGFSTSSSGRGSSEVMVELA
jgi:hypothetical protein